MTALLRVGKLLRVALLLPLVCAGCGGNGKSKDPPDLAQEVVDLTPEVPDLAEDIATAATPVVLPPPVVLAEYSVVVSAKSTIGPVGKEFELEARIGRGETTGQVTYQWDFGGGTAAGGDETGPAQQVTFAQAGQYPVVVTVTDEGEVTAESGVLLTVMEAGVKHTVGDVDGNGTVTQKDADLAAAHLEGEELLKPQEFYRADVTFDGRL